MLYERLDSVKGVISTQMNSQALANEASMVGIELEKLTDDEPMSD